MSSSEMLVTEHEGGFVHVRCGDWDAGISQNPNAKANGWDEFAIFVHQHALRQSDDEAMQIVRRFVWPKVDETTGNILGSAAMPSVEAVKAFLADCLAGRVRSRADEAVLDPSDEKGKRRLIHQGSWAE